MTNFNLYATVAEYKAYITKRGASALVTDAADDAVLGDLIESASRYIDDQTQRRFYPFIQTRYFDVPNSSDEDPLCLKLDEDLLEIISLSNGDGTTIPSNAYDLRNGIRNPGNESPYKIIRLKDNVPYQWYSNTAGNVHGVISVTGIWGFHNRYDQAWRVGSTLTEDLDISEVGFDVVSIAAFAAGQTIKIDTEIGVILSVASLTLTMQPRPQNGSTAAVHSNAATVYYWKAMESLHQAVLETVYLYNKRRIGDNVESVATLTGGGAILTPRDLPASARDFIKLNRRYL